jgi:hypothetical protein
MKLLLIFYEQKSYFLEITQFISTKALTGQTHRSAPKMLMMMWEWLVIVFL